MGMAILGMSELWNPLTDWRKIWHTWLRRRLDLVCEIYVYKRNSIQIRWQELFQLTSMHLNLNVIVHVRAFTVHLCFVMGPGKTIFAVLHLWMSPLSLQWVLNW